MTLDGFVRLAVQTVTAPREVARLLVSLKLSRDVLWLLFALVVTLNAMMFAISLLMVPANDLLGPILGNLAVFGAILAMSVGALIVALTVCGRPLGGTGTLERVAILIIWMQALRVVVQAVLIVLGPISVFLSGIVLSLATVLGLWILVNFVDVAHEVGSLLKSGMILLLAVVAMMLGLSVVFSLLGIQTGGMPGYV